MGVEEPRLLPKRFQPSGYYLDMWTMALESARYRLPISAVFVLKGYKNTRLAYSPPRGPAYPLATNLFEPESRVGG
jgi:hypothetical protein